MTTRIAVFSIFVLTHSLFAIEPLTTVARVDLKKYAGLWYEIARFPNPFQKECDQATAQYVLGEEGKVAVINTCRKLADGSQDEVRGVAKVVDTENFTKLKVNFVPSWLRWTGVGEGDYWIILLHPEYEYAVVSEPARKYLWILNRKPVLDKATYEKILLELKAKEFDTDKLIFSSADAVH